MDIMQHNLRQIAQNPSYFSCFLTQQQPSNPFQKKLFDKNLRKSSVSCGHYSKTNRHNHDYEQSNNSNHESPKISNLNDVKNISQSRPRYLQCESEQKHNIQQGYKMKIKSVIDNFRQQLDYLQEKMNDKVEQFQQKHNRNQITQEIKNKQIQFMIENLQKVMTFMIQNCLNLQDALIYQENQSQSQQLIGADDLNNQMYQFFGATKDDQSIKKQQIPFRDFKQNLKELQQRQEMQDEPRFYFVNGEMCQKQKGSRSKSNKVDFSMAKKTLPRQQQQDKQNSAYNANKQNKILIQRHNNKKKLNGQVDKKIQKEKIQPSQKSIYQTVLEQRQRKMKMKKKNI